MRSEAQSIINVNNDPIIRFMELLFAAIYVFSPQGRISGILDMKMYQVADLLGPGVLIILNYICINNII